jgi:hypothetical protein
MSLPTSAPTLPPVSHGSLSLGRILRWGLMVLSLVLLVRMVATSHSEIRDAIGHLLTRSGWLGAAALLLEGVWVYSLSNVYRASIRGLGGSLGRGQAFRISMGAFGRDGQMQVLGTGSVTIATDDSIRVYPDGFCHRYRSGHDSLCPGIDRARSSATRLPPTPSGSDPAAVGIDHEGRHVDRFEVRALDDIQLVKDIVVPARVWGTGDVPGRAVVGEDDPVGLHCLGDHPGL